MLLYHPVSSESAPSWFSCIRTPHHICNPHIWKTCSAVSRSSQVSWSGSPLIARYPGLWTPCCIWILSLSGSPPCLDPHAVYMHPYMYLESLTASEYPTLSGSLVYSPSPCVWIPCCLWILLCLWISVTSRFPTVSGSSSAFGSTAFLSSEDRTIDKLRPKNQFLVKLAVIFDQARHGPII